MSENVEHRVSHDGRSLTATPVNGSLEHGLRLVFTLPNGDSQTDIVVGGAYVSRKGTIAKPNAYPKKLGNGNTKVPRLNEGYDGLGYELKAKLPGDWQQVLGSMFS